MGEKRRVLKSIMGCGLLAGALLHSSYPLASANCAKPNAHSNSNLEQEIELNRLYQCAKSGNPDSQLILGRLLVQAEADSAASKWYQRAAKQGLAQAQFELAILYLDGKGVQENTSLALDWLDRAAKQGHQQAKFVFDYVLNADFSIGC